MLDTTVTIHLDNGSSIKLSVQGATILRITPSVGAGESIRARFFDVPTCAAYICRTPEAVRQLVKRAEIPYVKVGRRVQFDRDGIDRWIQMHHRSAARKSESSR